VGERCRERGGEDSREMGGWEGRREGAREGAGYEFEAVLGIVMP
jgi:hypothetical protein